MDSAVFSAGPTGIKSQNFFPIIFRRRRGSTSPPLTNVEANPGPHRKRKSHKARSRRQQHLGGLDELHLTREAKLADANFTALGKRYNVKTVAVSKRAKQTQKKPPRSRKSSRKSSDEIKEQPVQTHKKRKSSPKPEKTPQMDPFQKGEMETDLKVPRKKRKSLRQIAREHNRDPKVVRDWNKRRKTPGGWARKKTPGSGRPRKTSTRTDREIKRLAKSKKKENISKITRELKESLDDPPSRMTVSRRVHESTARCYRLTKKPLILSSNKEDRWKWAETHLNWTTRQWEQVVWSDESRMTLWLDNSGGVVWLPPEHSPNDRIAPQVPHGGGGFNIWGCFHAGGVGPLVKVEEKMNGRWYKKEILEPHAMPFMDELIKSQHKRASRRYRVWCYQHDNARPHDNHDNNAYLDSKINEWKPKFKVLVWPSHSPDLNPIENLWAHIKDKLRDYQTRPTNVNVLWKRVQKIWKEIPRSLLKNLAHSMPKRVRDVIKNEGWSISY